MYNMKHMNSCGPGPEGTTHDACPFKGPGPTCRDSLLYKGSEDDEGLELEVTGWAWNKRTKTRTMMMATRIRVKGSMVAVRLRIGG
jgi:hypothetical protein